MKNLVQSKQVTDVKGLLSPYILTKDGIPSGRELMNQPEISVFVANKAEAFQAFPEPLKQDVSKMWAMVKGVLVDAPIPDEQMQVIMSHALSYWYEGKIKFTNDPDEANIYVGVYDELGEDDIIRGEAVIVSSDQSALDGSWVNLDSNNTHSNKAAVMLSADLLRQDDHYGSPVSFQDVLDTAAHEVGHVFGILHPNDERAQSILSEQWDSSELVPQMTPDTRLPHDLNMADIIKGR